MFYIKDYDTFSITVPNQNCKQHPIPIAFQGAGLQQDNKCSCPRHKGTDIGCAKSSFYNEEDGYLLSCPTGSYEEKQHCVTTLEKDSPFSTHCALPCIPS